MDIGLDAGRLRNLAPDWLVLVAEEVTHAHNGIDLFRSQSRQQVPPDRFCVYRVRSIQFLPAEFCQHDENSIPSCRTPLNESSFFHSRQLVREAAFIPTHYPGQFLLAHLPFPNRGQTRQNSEFRTGKCGSLRDVPTDPTQHIFAHTSE